MNQQGSLVSILNGISSHLPGGLQHGQVEFRFDAGMDGMREVRTMGRMIERTQSPMRLLVASIRSSEDLVILASRGLNTFTLVPRVVLEMMENELTKIAVESFNRAILGAGS